ncbi:MAG: hypothetical protein IKR39_07025 [Lachnospiraceae bacterium]|nr:hypothetical protein [Lachnospiraceae bacterium]
MKICSNCGGSYDEKESKCPYCGMINEVGAEKEYNDKLNKIRKDLDNVDELAVIDYKSELKAFLKVFAATLLIAGFISIMAVSARISRQEGLGSGERKAMDLKIEEIRLFRDVTDKWDELYDAGKYDEMCDTIASETRKINAYDWQHYNFYKGYEAYRDARYKIADVLSKESAPSYYKADAIHSSLYAYYMTVSSKSGYKFKPQEKAFFDEEWPKLKKEVCEAFDLTETEFDTLRIRAGSDSYPDYTEVSHFVEERWGK